VTAIVGISGSLRQGSYNTAMLRAASAMAPEGARIEAASIAEIPLYNADVQEQEGFPAPVTELKDRLAAADGLLICTPEYNWGIPGVTKNAVDWLSRPADDIPRVFGDLPVGLIGAGGRSGTRYAQAAWLPVLRTLGTRAWFGATLFVARSWEAFSDEGDIIDPKVRELLERFVQGFAAYCAEQPRRRTA
jgi:chromate reductase, NAD(P)H dehydrogenase (quinone)